MTIGAIAGHHIDDLVEKYNLEVGRYPIEIEYKITNNCISNHNEPLDRKIYSNKTDICICALEKTELEYDYNNYVSASSKDEFLDTFEEKAHECKTMRK